MLEANHGALGYLRVRSNGISVIPDCGDTVGLVGLYAVFT